MRDVLPNKEPLGDRDAQDSERSPHATCVGREHAVEAIQMQSRGSASTAFSDFTDTAIAARATCLKETGR